MDDTARNADVALPRYRISEVMCEHHRVVCTEHWPVLGAADLLIRSCEDCLKIAQAVTGGRAIDMRVPDWAESAFGEEHDAYHEAGHTVAAALGGIPIRRVRLGELVVESELTSTGEVQAAGVVEIGDGETPISDFTAYVWSGMRATRAWLALRGQATVANLVDSVSKGTHDTAALQAITEPHGLPIETGRDRADEIMARHWPAVQTMAAALLRERTLTGPEVAEILRLLLPVPVRVAADVNTPELSDTDTTASKETR
ncbi:hypothetical protein ACFXPR_36745 [Nocardia tengchongensis]|uniref:hypothetical protein n=1 Tax=Nocardia tengchongensis TaxID=2055889 RepID=UPI00368381DE